MTQGSRLIRSPLFKLITIAVLTGLMVVPLVIVSMLRGERSQRAGEVASEVAGAWAGEQILAGPVLLLPYVARTADGLDQRTTRRVLAVLPDSYRQSGEVTVEQRRRGIFEVPVFRGELDIAAQFGPVDVTKSDPAAVAPVWEEAAVVFYVADPRGLEREVSVRIGTAVAVLEPGGGPMGFQVPTLQAPVRGIDGTAPFTVATRLDLKGARALSIVPVGRAS